MARQQWKSLYQERHFVLMRLPSLPVSFMKLTMLKTSRNRAQSQTGGSQDFGRFIGPKSETQSSKEVSDLADE
jgi:hypothetical protein